MTTQASKAQAEYDETPSQLRRRLPLGIRVRHHNGWEGTVVGYEYGQVGIKADEGAILVAGGPIRFCYGRNVTTVTQSGRHDDCC